MSAAAPPLRVPALLLCLDARRIITLCEGSLVARIGLDSEQALGRELSSAAPHLPQLVDAVKQALNGEPASLSATIGGLALDVACHPQRSARGKIVGALLVATPRDGTSPLGPGRVSTRDELRALYTAIDDAVFILDIQGRYLDIAPTNPGLLARPAEELIDHTLHEVLPTEQADLFLKTIRSAIQRGATTHLEYSLTIGDEQKRFAAAVSPLPPDRVVWVARDITERGEKDEALRESEERYRQLFDSIADICFVIDRDWHYTHANRAASRVTRQNAPNFIGKTVSETIPHIMSDPRILPYRQVMESGQPRSFVTDLPLLPDTLPGRFEMQVHAIADGILCIAHDITDRMRAEEALRQSEERYHTLFEESREAIFITGLDGVIIDFNQATLDMFGLTRQDVAHITLTDLYVDVDERDRIAVEMARLGAVRDYPLRLRRKTGGEMDCLVTASVWRSPDGAIQGYQGILRDITSQKRADEALRESEARFRAVFEGATLGIAVFDLTGRPMLVNAALQAILEASEDELRGMTLREFTHPDDLPYNWGLFTELVQGRRDNYQLEKRYLTRSGEAVWVNVTTSLVWDTEDKPLYAIAIVEDIRERRRAEDALRESEERYRRLVEFSPEPLAVHVGGKLVYCNTACVNMLGAHSADDLIGRAVLDFVHPDYREIVTERIRQVQQAGQETPLIQEKFIRLDGAVIDVEVVSIPTIYHGQRGSQVIMRDITDRVRAEASERALAEALRKTSAALNSTLELDEVLDLILSSVGQVVPHEAATIMLIEEGVARVAGHHGYAERGYSDDVKALRFTVDAIPTMSQMASTRQPVIVSDLDAYSGWLKMRHTDWIKSYVGAPISLGDEVLGFINLEAAASGYFTEAHAARLQTFADQAGLAIKNARLYADLRRHAAELEERNNDLDAFSHTVAHDLKAPLHVIIGYTSLILSDYTDQLNPEIMAHLNNVAQYANKLDTLIESMMLLAKLRSADVQIVPVQPGPLVEAAADRFQIAIRERNIRIDIAPDMPPAMAYAPWLEEVFANLIENAIKYLGSKNAAPHIAIRGDAQPDGVVRFQVEDNGIGISEENRQGLFRMFTRVHPTGDVKGAGLGLSIVERIVHRLNGQVGVESAPGKGSIFWFSLRGASQPSVPADGDPPAA